MFPAMLELEKKYSAVPWLLTVVTPDGEMLHDCPVVEAVTVQVGGGGQVHPI